jgi:hypothetical protein
MSEHTPGPWAAKHTVGAGWSVKMARPRPDYTEPDPVCSMAWWQFDKPGIIDDEISKANAMLIAAAPELLAALESAVENGKLAAEDFLFASYVIRKAKGESE